MRHLEGRELGGRYQMLRQIGVGSTSTVWQANDQVLQRTVAVKVINDSLHDDPAFIERFRRDAMGAARLSGPGIVAIYDTVREPGIDAVVMEFLTGMPLSDFLRKHAPLSAGDTVHLGHQVLAALGPIHDAGVVHARINPETIILCDDRRVKLTDAGFLVIATLEIGPYAAPEVGSGRDPDARSDLFSLGAVLYECLTGTLPHWVIEPGWSPPSMASLADPPPAPLEAALRRALSFEPGARFEAASDFAAALDRVELTRAPQNLRPPPQAPPDAHEPDRQMAPALLAAAVAAIFVLAGLALIATSSGRDAVRDIAEGIGLIDPGDSTTEAPSAEAPPAAPAVPNEEQPEPPAAGGAILTLSTATAFDPPPGEGSEHNALAPLAIDGDEATVWHSESYATRDFGGLKSGVGLVVTADGREEIGTIDVLSPSQGWSLEIYAADEPAADLAGWGDPRAGATAVSGSANFDLGGAPAGAILIWVTDLGSGSSPVRIDIAEVVLHSPTE